MPGSSNVTHVLLVDGTKLILFSSFVLRMVRTRGGTYSDPAEAGPSTTDQQEENVYGGPIDRSVLRTFRTHKAFFIWQSQVSFTLTFHIFYITSCFARLFFLRASCNHF